MRRGAKTFSSDYVALAGLIIYLLGQLFFRYCTAVISFPEIDSFHLLDFTEQVAASACVCSLVLRKTPITRLQFSLMIICAALLFLSSTHTKDYRLFYALLVIVSVSEIDFQKVLRIVFITVAIGIVAAIALSTTGIIFNKDSIPNARIAFAYGLGHPNTLGALFVTLCSSLSLLFWTQRNWWLPLIISLSSAGFSYFILSSHSSAIVLALLSAFLIVDHLFPFFRRRDRRGFFYLLCVLIPVACASIMIVSTLFYNSDNGFVRLIDSATHGRLTFAHAYSVANNGATELGRPYSIASSYKTGVSFNGVDCGYCYLLLVVGILPSLALFLTYFIAIINRSVGRNRIAVLAVVVVCSLHLMIENLLLFIPLGLPLFFLSATFSSNHTPLSPSQGIGSSPDFCCDDNAPESIPSDLD